MTTTTPSPSITNAALEAACTSLVSSGAKWKPIKNVGGATIHTLADVSYAKECHPSQSLDLYFSHDVLSENHPKRPVYIHIHGGGWSRGGKASPFYGGPAMCQNAAALAGCISVAPGYRLGKYPDFMQDVAHAIKWVSENISSLGGDLTNVFLSGHSAGGHIASLLVLRHSCFLEPLGIPRNFFRGLVLVSGVYDLFSPLRSAALDAKNKWFVVAYVLPAFGTNEQLRREASPLLLLEPHKETSTLGTIALALTRRFSQSKLDDDDDDVPISEAEGNEKQQTSPPQVAANEPMDDSTTATSRTMEFEINTSDIPPVLIMNASFDMGLQENGELMAQALSKHTKDVKYVLVKGADHASICWNDSAAHQVADFVLAKIHKSTTTTANDNVKETKESSSNVVALARGRVRRGQRDKMPLYDEDDESQHSFDDDDDDKVEEMNELFSNAVVVARGRVRRGQRDKEDNDNGDDESHNSYEC